MHMVNSLVKDCKDIVCLYSGKIFNFDNVNYKVIWPDKERAVSRREREKCIQRIDIIRDLFKEDKQINEIIFNFKENMQAWFKQLENDNNEEKETKIKDILEKQSYIIDKLNGKRKEFNSIILEQNSKKALYYLSKDLSKKMNENSIVFHNNIPDEDLYLMSNLQKAMIDDEQDKISNIVCVIGLKQLSNIKFPILMMGDITTKIIDGYLKDRFYNINYEYIKVPHHGTKTHYSENIPGGYNFLISTGKFGKYNGICDRYQRHQMIEGNRICTSGCNCEGKRSGNCCNNGQCNTGSQSKYVLRYNDIFQQPMF